mmetsp:Transcript_17329/g.37641  ORF Transcript_17329/g.37641 Transcript_17329/m.37641 type:complete len:123 (+) Transcript_17329:182-550(+)
MELERQDPITQRNTSINRSELSVFEVLSVFNGVQSEELGDADKFISMEDLTLAKRIGPHSLQAYGSTDSTSSGEIPSHTKVVSFNSTVKVITYKKKAKPRTDESSVSNSSGSTLNSADHTRK